MCAIATTAEHAAARPESQRFTRDEIAALKKRDNLTNFGYIAGIYAVIIITAVAAIGVFEAYRAGEIGLGWAILAGFLAVLSMGASQHQFGAVIHEATHYVLFENRKLNELASDWLAGFPIYTSTQSYRLHHFAHHQFVNDPDRDPIATQASESGHWLDFPVTHIELAKGFLKLLLPTNLVRYLVTRARHSSMPDETNPYFDEETRPNVLAVRIAVIYLIGLPLALVALVATGQFFAAAMLLVGSYVLAMAYYLAIPEHYFMTPNIKPVISDRYTTIGRLTYATMLYGLVTVAEYATGAPAWGYLFLLWFLPLFTAFPVFMVLREWIQHGNADRGRYTNSRVFLVDPLSRYAVFPLGMDYHLPHHLYASVPHYRLKALHKLLQRDPAYVEKCRIVRGWTGNVENMPGIVEVLGPRYAVHSDEITIDEKALENAEIRNPTAIAAQVEASRKGRIWRR